jgi:hypothetical protein
MVDRTNFHLFIRYLSYLLLPLLLLALAVPAVQAHGGGTPKLVTEPAGPYLVSAWAAPDPPRTDELHITIAVSEMMEDASAGPPVLDATVDVELVAQDGSGATVQSQATTEAAANKLYYETDMELPHEGPWQARITVSGPQGSGQSAFDLEVLPPGAMNWTLIGVLGAAAVTGVFIATTLRGRKANS